MYDLKKIIAPHELSSFLKATRGDVLNLSVMEDALVTYLTWKSMKRPISLLEAYRSSLAVLEPEDLTIVPSDPSAREILTRASNRI